MALLCVVCCSVLEYIYIYSIVVVCTWSRNTLRTCDNNHQWQSNGLHHRHAKNVSRSYWWQTNIRIWFHDDHSIDSMQKRQLIANSIHLRCAHILFHLIQIAYVNRVWCRAASLSKSYSLLYIPKTNTCVQCVVCMHHTINGFVAKRLVI